MSRNAIRRRIEALVRRLYNAEEDEPLSEELVLLGEDGSFDSVAALQLLLAVEEEFGIVVQDEEIRPENLKSLSCLTRFIEGKLCEP